MQGFVQLLSTILIASFIVPVIAQCHIPVLTPAGTVNGSVSSPFAFQCDVSPLPNQYIWQMNSVTNPSQIDSRWFIQNLQGGIYRCGYTKIGCSGTLWSNEVTIITPPILTVSPENIIADEGQTVKLQCQAAGYPTPSITWYFNGTVVGNQPNLTLTSASSDDSGQYTCLAVNSAGYASLLAQVSILSVSSSTTVVQAVTSIFSQIMPPSTSMLTDQLSLVPATISTSMIYTPSITWYFNGTVVGNQVNLTLTSALSDDSGQYTCLAVNSAGYASLLAQVSVLSVSSSTTVVQAITSVSSQTMPPSTSMSTDQLSLLQATISTMSSSTTVVQAITSVSSQTMPPSTMSSSTTVVQAITSVSLQTMPPSTSMSTDQLSFVLATTVSTILLQVSPTLSPDNTSSTIIALSSVIVVISIALIFVLAYVLGWCIIKRKYMSIQDTIEVNITSNSAYGITQEHLYAEINNLQSLDYEELSAV